jgi:transposase
MMNRGADALYAPETPVNARHRDLIVALAAQHRLPAMYASRDFVEAGGLMAYGPSFPALFRQAATYVDKILKGTQPADLPVEQPTHFELAINRPRVYAYPRRDTPPAPRRPQRSKQVLRPYMPYLIRRWREGTSDSRQLWREIQAQGYAHSARTVCRFITQLRRASEAGHAPEAQGSPYTRPQGPSARAVSFTLVCPAAKRAPDAQTYVEQLCQGDAGVARANQLVQAFLAIARERRGDDLEAWMAEATYSGIDELARFARGLQEDSVAIKAGLTLAWSNGVTEGQIHRLKLVKRQGYGRASFALLRQRVLHAA